MLNASSTGVSAACIATESNGQENDSTHTTAFSYSCPACYSVATVAVCSTRSAVKRLDV